MVISAMITTHACTTLMSCEPMLCTTSCPRPGHANTVSVISAPPTRFGIYSATMVTTGTRAFLKACLNTTLPLEMPLLRAVRI